MKDISNIDKNLVVKTAVDGLVYYNATNEPFSIHGLILPSEEVPFYTRIPNNIAKSVSEGVYNLNSSTAGGRIKFKTDSKTIAIKVKLSKISWSSHFTLCGSTGFDLYANGKYVNTFMPPKTMELEYSASRELPDKSMREITINFPTYSGVESLEIGLEPDCKLQKSDGYKLSKPIVYYGSSITQGGCASRPGNTYQGHIERRFNADYINLGWSGSAKGENEMAHYIAGLDMSVFVYDYDYNAPSIEHLQNTHERMFKIIRESHPETPVIMMTIPHPYTTEKFAKRKEIIKQTYLNAKNSGDNNVYFIDGAKMMRVFGDDAADSTTVDNCHPNDLGFMCMAKTVGDLLENIL